MKPNKYIHASYKLYDVTDGKKELVEETSPEQPFTFISGLGLLLDAFEKQVVDLAEGDNFEFTLTPEQAYGETEADRVIDLDKQLFVVDGHFDDKNVYKDAIIPLQNEDGNLLRGRVLEVTDDQVKIDMNHPLAGCTLHFEGSIIENRDATNEELSEMVGQITGQNEEGCCCGGHHHGEGECCGKHHHEEGECCGKHHHGDGECCGKHHHGEGECCHKED